MLDSKDKDVPAGSIGAGIQNRSLSSQLRMRDLSVGAMSWQGRGRFGVWGGFGAGSSKHRPAVAFGARRASAPARRPAVARVGHFTRAVAATSGRLDGLLAGGDALVRGRPKVFSVSRVRESGTAEGDSTCLRRDGDRRMPGTSRPVFRAPRIRFRGGVHAGAWFADLGSRGSSDGSPDLASLQTSRRGATPRAEANRKVLEPGAEMAPKRGDRGSRTRRNVPTPGVGSERR
jgi:hypothetical protein